MLRWNLMINVSLYSVAPLGTQDLRHKKTGDIIKVWRSCIPGQPGRDDEIKSFLSRHVVISIGDAR